MEPAKSWPTEMVSMENSPLASCACWYAAASTSPRMTMTVEGGMICPSVPAAQMLPVAKPGS